MSLTHPRRGWMPLFALGLVMALLGSACGSGDESDTSSTTAATSGSDASVETDTSPDAELDLSGVRLRVGVVATVSGFRTAIYERSGAFDDAPYEIEWVEFEGSSATMEALNAGAIDVAVTMQAGVAVLAQGNASSPWTTETAAFTIVAAEATVNDPGQLILAHADSGIETVEDLAGKQITYPAGLFGHYFLIWLLQQSGMGADDYTEVLLPGGEGRAAFSSGAVDAIVLGYRNALPLIGGGEVTVIAQAGDYLDAYSVTIARRGVLDDPAIAAAVEDLVERVDATQVWSLDNLDEVTEIFISVGNMSSEDAQVAAEITPKRRVPLDDAVVESLQSIADVFFQEGVIQNDIDVNVIVDRRFEGGAGTS